MSNPNPIYILCVIVVIGNSSAATVKVLNDCLQRFCLLFCSSGFSFFFVAVYRLN